MLKPDIKELARVQTARAQSERQAQATLESGKDVSKAIRYSATVKWSSLVALGISAAVLFIALLEYLK
ncbi:MAG: hypothetical protein ACR2OF_00620 [Hyphomicrobium sp.]